jgi:hypothetical protein
MIDGETVRWLGVVLFAVGGAFEDVAGVRAGQPIQGLGRDSVGTRAGEQRHLRGYPSPSYLGLLIGSLGWLSFGSRRGFSHSFLFRFSWPGSVQKRTY